MLCSLLAGSAVAQAQASPWADTDNDGLCDSWEKGGFGPLDPKTMGCKPDHADIVIAFRPRPGVTREKLQPVIDRMEKFYAAMPHKNPDGKVGIHMIPIILPNMEDKYKDRGYNQLYNEGMPEEWRGLAHGVLVEDSPGGGGQADRADWCGTGYNFWTIVHEVGHQLGLSHEPLTTGVGSPFYTSLMNYDYLYQFNGDSGKVHFSTGKFASLKLKQTDLDEEVPFPAGDLTFLTKRPHYLTVKSLDARHSLVDWNRNGVLGEHHVRTNIDDGYSVGIRDLVKGEKSDGAPAVAAVGKDLYCVQPEGGKGDFAHPSADNPARAAAYRVQPDGKFERVFEGPAGDVTGDISAIGDGKALWLAYSTKSGWKLTGLAKGAKGVVEVSTRSFAQAGDPVLMMLDGRVQVVARATGGNLSLIDLRDKEGEPQPLGLTSTQPAGVAWNPKHRRLAVVTVEDRKDAQGVMVVHEFAKVEGGWKQTGKPVTVGGDKSPARTSGRPLLLVDRDGLYNVYCKGHYKSPDDPGLNFLCRQVASGSGWWIKMMGNEWANSRSVGAVCPFGGDIVYAYRWYGGPEDNRVWLHRKGSGIHDQVITDFDDVSFIFEHGLHDSLRQVQRDQWKIKG